MSYTEMYVLENYRVISCLQNFENSQVENDNPETD
jgi:hypothetical protein